MDTIVITLTKSNATAEEVDAVVSRLKRGVPVERGTMSVLIGGIDQAHTRIALNCVDGGLTLAVRESHGEWGLIVAAAIAVHLKQDLVGVDTTPLPASVETVTTLLARPLSEDGRVLAEKLGLVLPRIKPGKSSIPF